MKAVVSVIPAVLRVNNGDMATLKCEAKGYPVTNITWKKDGIPVSDGIANQQDKLINQYDKEIKIGPVSLSDNETVYTCEVIQESSVTNNSNVLIVKRI